jgi:hypothetical protein
LHAAFLRVFSIQPGGEDEAITMLRTKQLEALLNDISENPLRIDGVEFAAQFKSLWSLYHLQPWLGEDEAITMVRTKQLEALLNDISENPLRIDGVEIAAQFKSLWSLYHLQPRLIEQDTGDSIVDLHSYTIELCGASVHSLLRDALMVRQVSDLWQAFHRTLERHGTLRGVRFEAYAHKKILMFGLAGPAVSLTQKGTGTRVFHVAIPASLPTILLPDNKLTTRLQTAVTNAQGHDRGGYPLPSLPNFPVADAIFVDAHSFLKLQMEAGPSKPLSDNSAQILCAAVPGPLVIVVPDESIITKKLAGGPNGLDQFRFVLNEL